MLHRVEIKFSGTQDRLSGVAPHHAILYIQFTAISFSAIKIFAFFPTLF